MRSLDSIANLAQRDLDPRLHARNFDTGTKRATCPKATADVGNIGLQPG
jgi:hypothetical protein